MLQSVFGGSPVSDPVPPFTSISGSLGVVDGNYMQSRYGCEGDGAIIEVDDIWAGIVVTYGSYSGCWVWTSKGRCTVLATFNHAYIDAEMMDRLLHDAVDRMLRGLGMERFSVNGQGSGRRYQDRLIELACLNHIFGSSSRVIYMKEVAARSTASRFSN